MLRIKVGELANRQLSCFIQKIVGPTTADLERCKGFDRKGQ
jgi:hypothetical protein